ncbi:uncharacterized protein EDB91DRAFT_890641 [Suillus paluster]|uniref:uncharacterized protein n=1 Tax=Suillus paluster TaxID=48578 RepID=UPI001B8691FC|nr:uncharacterized protein EDB91DRAFT_890641 [Suillus paluster]KAG1727564.1 hypothetical protein EDB91DRAFT_890641 [Suillus paluster]
MNPSRKKPFGTGWLRRNRSNPHSPVGSEASEIETSSFPPSRDESPGKPPGLFRKLWGKANKRSARSARQSSNPEPAVASSSAPDLLPTQTTQNPSPLTAPTHTPTPTPEPNLDQPSNSGIPKAEQPDPKSVNKRIIDATKGVAGMKNVPVMAQNAASQTNNLQSVPDTIDTFSAILKPLKAFNSIANVLADAHPYAKVALSIFTYASQMILDQADRDAAVSGLLSKISEVYTFITEEEALASVPSMPVIYGKIARQTLECADFIAHYSETTSAWKRLGKHAFKETQAAIESYNEVLDSLMQQFRDRAARDTLVIVHHMGKSRPSGLVEP